MGYVLVFLLIIGAVYGLLGGNKNNISNRDASDEDIVDYVTFFGNRDDKWHRYLRIQKIVNLRSN